MNRILFTLLFLVGVVLDIGAAPLRCNYNSADISTTEDEHCMLAGFAARKDLHDGIHTPLRASALAFTDGSVKVCLLSLDMMELSPALADEMRDSISALSGLAKENILLHCIHTHSAPRVGGRWVLDGAANRSFKDRFEKTVINLAVKTICEEREYRRFSVETGSCTTDINGNRCEKDGPCDRNVVAVRLLDRHGKPICAFFNISCHPVCMGPKSYLLGADYSGVARRIISEKWGCEVFQISGAQGNIDPALGPKDSEYAEQCGQSLADSLSTLVFRPMHITRDLRLTSGVTSLPYRRPEVTVKDIQALGDSLVVAYADCFPRFADDVKGWVEQMTEEIGDKVITSLDFNMSALNLGGLLMFFTQGEPFCEYQMAARAAFPESTVIFAAYTNGQSSYLPSERAFRVRKGYEYELDQDFVYVKSPYPLSSSMPKAYIEGMFKTIARVAGEQRYSIIPQPASLTPETGCFRLGRRCPIVCDPEFMEAAEDFAIRAGRSTGCRFIRRSAASRGIVITRVEGLGDEEYRLNVTPSKVVVEASAYAGAFYGLQTLCQLFPASIYSDSRGRGVRWEAPCCEISDAPRYGYRGMLLDCGRYFYPKEEVMKFIDLMAIHKQNYLQWHLTEDQGWRIEIKKYPLLTEVGAWRTETRGYEKEGDGVPHGGFYSQDDVREIVEYARRRNVTVIPEIELPGHSSAAIASYPWLSCTPDSAKVVATTWGVKEDVYCPKPETIQFIEDVFTELFDLFPSPYYHIGGDECPKTAWRNSNYCKSRAKELGLSDVDDLQDYFVNHFDAFLRQHGKTVIAWDEILDGKPAGTTVVMSYRGHNPASRAMDSGMKTILCPNRWAYFDYDQQETEDIPFNHHLFLTLRKSYSWDWESFVDDDILARGGENMLGVQACVWGEHIPDVVKLETQTFPREASIAETGWTVVSRRDWNHFKLRMGKEFERLEALGVNYSKAYDNVIVNMSLIDPYPRFVELEIDNPSALIRYTTDGSDPTAESALVPALILVDKGDTVKAQGYTVDGEAVGELMTRTF